MRKKLVLTTLALVIGLLAASGPQLLADTFYAATVTFSDRLGDNVTSDSVTSGKHAYVNGGPDKLESGFHTVTNDFVLRATKGARSRYLAFSFAPITPPTAPAGTLEQRDLFMNIRAILAMSPGTATSAIAVFQTALGELKLTPNTTWIDTSTYATQVFVSRNGNIWTITADPGVPPGPGDVAALTQTKRNTEQLVGLYHMPFQITIDCTTCP